MIPHDYPIVDAHFHHWNTDRYWRSALEGASRRGVVQIWISGVRGPGASRQEVIEANEFTLSITRRHGDLFRGFVFVDPPDKQHALDDVRKAIEKDGMIGIKLWVSCFCDDERVFPIADYAQERRVPLLVHAWDKATGNLPFESTASNVAELARLFPELPIIMAHHGGDWIHATRHVERATNVLVDTSGSIQDHGLVDYLVRRLGPRRVVFGTDCSDFATQLAKVAAARIDEEAKRLIFGQNALRLVENRR